MKQMEYKSERETSILHSGTIDEYEFIIVSYGTHPCCYVGLPTGHELRKVDDIDCGLIGVHGGVTYQQHNIPFDFETICDFWMGWDYAHCYDYQGMYMADYVNNYKKWSTEEMFEDVKNCIEQLKEMRNDK